MKSKDLIKKHEGLRLVPYKDTEGVLTVGYGHNLTMPITLEQAEELFDADMEDVLYHCKSYSWYEGLNEARQAVIQNMIFNLGPSRFSKFKKTIAHIKAGDYSAASIEMLDSKWSKQVGPRAVELSEIMLRGSLEP